VVVAGNYWYGIDKLLDRLMQGPSDQVIPYTWSNYLTYTFYYEILLTGWSVLYLVARFWFVLAEQRRRAQEADSLARHSRIQMLRYQLNPHFLFNALNSARALVDENEQHARDMITELSEFLRYSLVTKNESDIPLSNEIEAVRHYFEVEKKRYEDKLKVDFAIDPLAEEYPVVPFLLHPLVENAVKYGMRTSPMPLSIRVSARVNADRLCIDVCNTGTWIEPKSGENERGTGTGLFNVRQRLQTLFPDRHRFTVDKNNGRVCIRIEVTNPLVPSSRQEVGP
jgi:LytS/YehU family sensor histidine kinase